VNVQVVADRVVRSEETERRIVNMPSVEIVLESEAH
jgi:hypothetical protein